MCVEADPAKFLQIHPHSSRRDGVNLAIANRSGCLTFARVHDNNNGLSGIASTLDVERARVFGITRINVTAISPHELLTRYYAHVPVLDYASVDVEGAELTIMNAWPFKRWCVNAFTIENNFWCSATRSILPALRAILEPRGYRCARRIRATEAHPHALAMRASSVHAPSAPPLAASPFAAPPLAAPPLAFSALPAGTSVASGWTRSSLGRRYAHGPATWGGSDRSPESPPVPPAALLAPPRAVRFSFCRRGAREIPILAVSTAETTHAPGSNPGGVACSRARRALRPLLGSLAAVGELIAVMSAGEFRSIDSCVSPATRNADSHIYLSLLSSATRFNFAVTRQRSCYKDNEVDFKAESA